MRSRGRLFGWSESGSITVATGLVGLILLGVGAVVFDISHAFVVRREIQQAAEAGAMAGARALALGTPRPNWDNAKTVATAAVQQNAADGQNLTDYNSGGGSLQKVQAGYWDLRWSKNTAPENLNGYLDPSSYTPSAQEVPAVKVTIAKTQGSTGSSGPMNTTLASIWGFQTMDLRTSAVVTTFPPSSAPPGDVLPLAFPKVFAENYWENQKEFRLFSDYHVEMQEDGTYIPDGGQWTSFLVPDNSAENAKNLVNNGNPDPLKVSDNIYIQPGTEASVYKELENRIGKTLLVAVVENDFATKAYTAVKALLAFKVTGYNQGEKYVQGHFVKDFVSLRGGTGGTFDPDWDKYTPTYCPPRLVN